MNPQDLATDCLTYFVTIDGTAPEDAKYRITDNRPEWFFDLVRECHFGFLPNDWSYRFVRDALLLCENCDTDGPQVDLDSEYPYTADRLNWFASHLERNSYCDEYAEETGFQHTGEYGGDVLALVAGGMYTELDRVARLVWDTLCEQAEGMQSDQEREAGELAE